MVVGLPLHLSGEEGSQAALTRTFCSELEAMLDVPVETYDERLTTRMAEASKREGAAAAPDSLAAAHLLQAYLAGQAAIEESGDRVTSGVWLGRRSGGSRTRAAAPGTRSAPGQARRREREPAPRATPPEPPKPPAEAAEGRSRRRSPSRPAHAVAAVGIAVALGRGLPRRWPRSPPSPTATSTRARRRRSVVRTITVTIPEGYSRAQTAEIAEQEGLRGSYEKASDPLQVPRSRQVRRQGRQEPRGLPLPRHLRAEEARRRRRPGPAAAGRLQAADRRASTWATRARRT